MIRVLASLVVIGAIGGGAYYYKEKQRVAQQKAEGTVSINCTNTLLSF